MKSTGMLILAAAMGLRGLARGGHHARPAAPPPLPPPAPTPVRTMPEHVHEQAGPKTFASGKTGPIYGDSRNVWFLFLLATFGSITAIAIVFLRHEETVELLASPLWLVLLALASYRLGRIMALDEVTQPLRMLFVEVKEINGEKIEVPLSYGLRGAVGALVTSPDSIGFWIAGVFVYLFVLWPTGLHLIIIVLAVNGLAELLNSVVHHLGRRSRGT